MGGKPKILFVRSFSGNPGIPVGGDIRSAAITGALSRAGDLQLFDSHAGSDRDFAQASRDAAQFGVLRRSAPMIRKLPATIQQAARTSDVIFLDQLAAFWWTGLADEARAIIDINDVPTQMFGQGLRMGSVFKRPAKWLRYRWTRWSERALLNRFRFSVVCSEDDREYLRHPRVEVVPNCYRPHPLMDHPPDANAPRDLLFVGTLFYPPNLEGLRWFVEEVFPALARARPGTTLTVVGRSPHPIPDSWGWLRKPGIEFVGTVEDVGPYVRSSKIEICPLFLGGGTRVKLIESLAFGVPAVSTTIGAYGLSVPEGQGIVRRDTREEFLEACTEMLADHGMRLRAGRAGQDFVRGRHSHEAVQRKVIDLVMAI